MFEHETKGKGQVVTKNFLYIYVNHHETKGKYQVVTKIFFSCDMYHVTETFYYYIRD